MQQSTMGARFAISALRKRSPRSPVGPIFSFALRFIHRAKAGLSLSWSRSSKSFDEGCFALGGGDEEKSKTIPDCGLGETTGEVVGLGDASSSLSLAPTPSRILSTASGAPPACPGEGAAKLIVVSPSFVFPVWRWLPRERKLMTRKKRTLAIKYTRRG